ncbi:hypothetical protein [Halorubrum sp. DM2]|uniref:hypothetical protein n=1 Tax=Halorubrum sp. DM2 TaxID=2527867 RepID=UPI0024B6825E|nr:hypothetical protein [Halorubrum sp. DM2]
MAVCYQFVMVPPVTAILPSRRAFGFALFGGILHLLIAGMLWIWFGFTTRVDLFLVYNSIGAMLLGAIPTLLLVTKQLVTPSFIVAGTLTVSAYGTWSVYVAPPVTPTPVGPTPFGWYLIGWVVVVALALVAGGAEYGVRHFRKGNNRPDSVQTHD